MPAERKVTAKRLCELSLPNDAEELGALPLPEVTDVSEASRGDLAKAAESLRDAWLTLLTDLWTPSDEAGDRGGDLPDHELCERLFFNIGAYFAHVVTPLLLKDELVVQNQVGFKRGDNQRLVDRIEELLETHRDDDGEAYEIREACAATFDFTTALWDIYLARIMAITPIREFATAALGHGSLEDLHKRGMSSEFDHLPKLIPRLVATVLAFMTKTYELIESTAGERHPGPFASLEVGELPLLARRAEGMSKKYGPKNVEAAFEHQLALLMQSLGLVVVQTRRAKRTVDLLVISSDPTERLTFLVEAKTTAAKTYSFPAADQRALAEYARTVRASLTTLPPLRFILLVSRAAAGTVAGKVRSFEAEHGTPLRFVPIDELVSTRELLPGPVPVSALAKQVLEGGPILPEGFGQSLAEAYTQAQQAHTMFVEAMLEARPRPAV